MEITKKVLIRIFSDLKSELYDSGINFTPELVNIVYNILNAYYIDNKKYVLLQAPTGVGKSIIGLLLSKAVNYIEKYNESNKILTSYYLTSTKVLQSQLDNDIKRFNISDTFILRGTENYNCSYLQNKLKNPSPEEYSYKERPCIGLSQKDINNSQYNTCLKTCEYKIAREIAAKSPCCITNYHYFLTVLGAKNPLFFNTRTLTICDEAHKLNSIIDDMYSYTMNLYVMNQIESLIKDLEKVRLINEYEFNTIADYIKDDINDLKIYFNNDYSYLSDSHKNPEHLNEFKNIFCKYSLVISQAFSLFRNIIKNTSDYNISIKIHKLNENLANILSVFDYINDLFNRNDDLYIIQEKPFWDKNIYKFIIKDLNEVKSIYDHFLSKCDRILFMSATMGDLSEFRQLYGLKEEDCYLVEIPSKFDFSKSPILLCNSGSLTRKNFQENIYKCVDDVLNIVKNIHPNEKGIIHTHTNNINKILMEMIKQSYGQDIADRFLFYSSSREKDLKLSEMMASEAPLILCGPSITEGLDLKDDIGRFNILIKVPYPLINEYAQRKIERFPFWYNRKTKEEIVQSIGRTNRHTNDYSTTYLIDSQFSKIVWGLEEVFTKRLVNFDIPVKIPEKSEFNDFNQDNDWDLMSEELF